MAFQKKRFDKEAIETGKWTKYDGGEFKLASVSSSEFVKAHSDYLDNKGKEGVEADNKAFCELIATTLLLDWKGVVDEAGEELPYSVDEAVEILMDDALFLNHIVSYAQTLDNYKRELVQKKAKK